MRQYHRIKASHPDAILFFRLGVTMRGYDGEVGRGFTGTFDIDLFDSPVEELSRLRPRELIAGYWREVATSWRAGTTLERSTAPEIP